MHRALTTRTGALTLAIILAAAAALMVFVYVKGYQSDVNGRGTEVSVLVANQTIPQLTPGNQVVEATMYRTTTVPKSSLVDGAVTNPDQLKGLVARNDVYPGEQLTTNQFVKSDTNSVAVNLKPNQRAIDFPAEPGQGLVGRLQVGDHVDVVANFEVVPIDPATGLPRQGGQSIPVTKTIAKDVLVLGVPDTSDSSTSATQAKDAVLTLAINVSDVQHVVFAQQQGDIYFVLRPPGSSDDVRPVIDDVRSVLRGTSGDQLLYTILGKGR
jgi:pilus assembly protein CpaB